MKNIILIAITSIALSLSGTAFANDYGKKVNKRFNQIDHNNNGQISKRELHHGNYLRKRIDVNDDGRIGKHERHYAKHVKNNADRNNDGRIGKAERHATRHTLNRVDRNH